MERGALAVDPWRPDTPHADEAPLRADTVLRPFKVIPGKPPPLPPTRSLGQVRSADFFVWEGGVHHYDEYGLRDLSAEPPEIEKIHLEMIAFVRAWLEEWKHPKGLGKD